MLFPDNRGTMNKEKISTIIFTLLATSLSYGLQSSEPTKVAPATKQKDSGVWLNIFIHGTVKPPLRIGDISSIRKDTVESSFYNYSAGFMRQDPRFFQYQPIQKLGMHPVMINDKRGNASGAFAEIYNIQYKDAYPEEKNFYYSWGWSGLLSRSKREAESKDFLKDLLKLVKQYKAFGMNPHIRLIAYSHGGNVVLNIARYREAQNLIINESVFVGVPVHKETDKFVNSPIFKKIYQIYSLADRAQSSDLFSTKHLFSHRKFKSRKCQKIDTSKIVHIRLSTTHTIEDPVCKQVTRSFKVDPRHIELWSFGWKPISYRRKFPLYPLSGASVLPYVIYKTKDLGDDLWVEINPYQERMRITSWKNNRKHNMWTLPFFSKTEFENLTKTALKYEPSELRKNCYTQIVKDALIYAINKQHAIFYSCLRARGSKLKPKENLKNEEIIKPVTTTLQGIESFILH